MRLTQEYVWHGLMLNIFFFLSVSNRGLGSVVCIVGIGFALLAHPWLGILSKKSANTY